MNHQLIDKWEAVPSFVLDNEKILFNGIYVPKGAYLTVHDRELIQFGFRGAHNPRILLRSPDWKLYDLELKVKPYENVIPGLAFSSAKLVFNDWKEQHASRKTLEGIVTGSPTENVHITGFEVFYLKASGEASPHDHEEDDEMEASPIQYDIDVDCAIMTRLSNEKAVYFEHQAGHEAFSVFFGREEYILEKIYPKTHWFDYPADPTQVKEWQQRTLP
jgi:hypothetical protein